MATDQGGRRPPPLLTERLGLREELRRRPRPRRGEVWQVFTPGQDDPHQPRCALVISVDARNEAADDFLVVPIYSRGSGPTRIPIRADEGGLDHDSVLFCEEITCLHEAHFAEGRCVLPFALRC